MIHRCKAEKVGRVTHSHEESKSARGSTATKHNEGVVRFLEKEEEQTKQMVSRPSNSTGKGSP